MSQFPPSSSGHPQVNFSSHNPAINIIFGNGNITSSNPVYAQIVVPEATPDTMAIIEKALGQHHFPGAMFEAIPESDNPGCMPGTRVQFLERVLAFLTGCTSPHIAWIAGMAGTGKTSIAITLCKLQWANPSVLLGGSFFCSRSTGTVERTDVQRIVPTLTMTLARQFPTYASALAKQLTDQPDVAHWTVRRQLEHLLTIPLLDIGGHDGQIVFVIDALDECSDQGKLAELIHALVDFVSVLPVKFLLTSRPEMYIRQTPISNPDLSFTLQVHTIDPTHVAEDMRLYICETLGRESSGTTWYTYLDVEALVQQSCGLFIFTSTALKYILGRSNNEGRMARLRKIVEAASRSTALTANLDAIYKLVLTEASLPDNVDSDELADTKRVLACILTTRASLSISALADILEIQPAVLRGCLERLPSLVHVPEDDDDHSIRTLHASFGDYMFDRAENQFSIKATLGHDTLARGCLRRMAQDDLCFNVSRSQSSFKPNPDKIPDWIPMSLLYACLQWAHHIAAASNSLVFADKVNHTFRRKLLYWLEVLSITDNMSVASGLLLIAGSAMRLSAAAQFLRDANSFVASSYAAIVRSAPHIYISALPFAAKYSLIHQCFGNRNTGSVSVTTFGIAHHGEGLVMTLTGHEGIVSSVAYSPDGLSILSRSQDGIARIWDAQTGVETITPIYVGDYTGTFCAMAFAQGSRCVAVCTSDGILRIREIQGRRETVHRLCSEFQPGEIVRFSRDGTLVACGSRNGTLRIWGTETGQRIFSSKVHDGVVTRIVFSPDGQLILSTSYDGVLHFWDCRTGQEHGDPLDTMSEHRPVGYQAVKMVPFTALAFSHDGRFLAAGMSSNGEIRVWDLEHPTQVPVVMQNDYVAGAIAFSPDGLRVAASCQKRIRCWNWRTTREIELSIQDHSDQVSSLSYSPDGLYIASGSYDSVIRIWSVNSDRAVEKPLQIDVGISCVAVSPDSSFIVTGSVMGSVRVWDVRKGEEKLPPLLGHEGMVVSVAISSDGKLIASGSDTTHCPESQSESVIRVWDAQTGGVVDELLKGYDCIVCELAFSPDTSRLASALITPSSAETQNAIAHVWDLRTKVPLLLGTFECSLRRLSIAFSPDGRLVAVGTDAGQIHICLTYTGQRRLNLWQEDDLSVFFVAFSQDSTKIMSGASDGTFYTWNIADGQLVCAEWEYMNADASSDTDEAITTDTDDSDTDELKQLVCSPSGRFIASSSKKTMRLRETVEPNMIATVGVNYCGHEALSFTSDEQSVILGGNDTVHVWNIQAVSDLASKPQCDPLAQFLRTGLQDGWVLGPRGELLLWVPPGYRNYVQLPPCTLVLGQRRVSITTNADGLRYGAQWTSTWRN